MRPWLVRLQDNRRRAVRTIRGPSGGRALQKAR